MATCGIWPARDGLVAVVADDDGRLISTHLAIRNDADCSDLIHHLDETEGLDWQLVLPEHHRANSVAQIAAENAVAVWIAPRRLVEPIRIAAGLTTGPPRRSALLLARIPLSSLRACLRPLGR